MDPFKPEVKAGDLPEVMLIPTGFTSNLHSTSSSSKVIQRYSLVVYTGSKRINALMNQIQWEVLVALANWKVALSPLEWRDKTFIKRLDVLSVEEGLTDPAANRNITGWSAVWQCEIEMIFTTSDLLSLI